MVSQPCFGRNNEIHNLARQDPGLFQIQLSMSVLNTPLYHLREKLPNKLARDCAFVTFGRVFISQLQKPTPLGTSSLAHRSISIFPLHLEWDRAYSAAVEIFRSCYTPNKYEKGKELDDLKVRIFKGSLAYTTRVEPIPSGSVNEKVPGTLYICMVYNIVDLVVRRSCRPRECTCHSSG